MTHLRLEWISDAAKPADEKKTRPDSGGQKSAVVVSKDLRVQRRLCTLPERLTPGLGRAGKSKIACHRTHTMNLAESENARKAYLLMPIFYLAALRRSSYTTASSRA